MDIKSEPKYEEFQVTEIAASYPGTDPATFTLVDGEDSYTFNGDPSSDIIVTLASGEVVRLESQNRNWYSIRTFTHRRLVKEPKA